MNVVRLSIKNNIARRGGRGQLAAVRRHDRRAVDDAIGFRDATRCNRHITARCGLASNHNCPVRSNSSRERLRKVAHQVNAVRSEACTVREVNRNRTARDLVEDEIATRN